MFKNISIRLFTFLEYKGISAYQLSKDTGISQSVISYIKQGKRLPSLDFLEKILKNYEVNLVWLLTGKGIMTDPAPTLSKTEDTSIKPSENSEIPFLRDLITRQQELITHLQSSNDRLHALIEQKEEALKALRRHLPTPPP